MELLINLVLVLHLLGMAALVGSAVLLARGQVTPSLVWGARAQLVTGILLVGLHEMSKDEPLNHTKVGIKLVVALAVAGCAEVAAARARKGGDPAQLVSAAGGLALLNTAIAVLWSSQS